MRHAFFYLQFRLKLGFFLGDDSLRCLSCAGKFGNIDLDRRCAVCGLILSDDLLQIYLKALVSADNYTRSPLGRRRASGSSGDRGKSRAGVAAQAKPQPPPGPPGEEPGEVKEEPPNLSPEKSPVREEEKIQSEEKERKDKVEPRQVREKTITQESQRVKSKEVQQKPTIKPSLQRRRERGKSRSRQRRTREEVQTKVGVGRERKLTEGRFSKEISADAKQSVGTAASQATPLEGSNFGIFQASGVGECIQRPRTKA